MVRRVFAWAFRVPPYPLGEAGRSVEATARRWRLPDEGGAGARGRGVAGRGDAGSSGLVNVDGAEGSKDEPRADPGR